MELSSGPAAAAADPGTVAAADGELVTGELVTAGDEVAATGGAVTV
jgi:hypothetical protein